MVIGVIGSASPTVPSDLQEDAEHIGRAMAAERVVVLTGGNREGLVGALTTACRRAGGRVVGVCPVALTHRHPALSREVEVRTVADRIQAIGTWSHMLLTLPGGLGTLEEYFALSGAYSRRDILAPPLIANLQNAWAPVFSALDELRATGLLHATHGSRTVADDAEEAIGLLRDAIRRVRSALRA